MIHPQKFNVLCERGAVTHPFNTLTTTPIHRQQPTPAAARSALPKDSAGYVKVQRVVWTANNCWRHLFWWCLFDKCYCLFFVCDFFFFLKLICLCENLQNFYNFWAFLTCKIDWITLNVFNVSRKLFINGLIKLLLLIFTRTINIRNINKQLK